MKKVLVTGSDGFLGSHITSTLHNLPVSLFTIRNKRDCDLRNINAVKARLQQVKPEAIIHLAASPDNKQNRCDQAFLNTISCTLNLLQAIPSSTECLFIHVGSYKQYGDIPVPFQENDKVNPTGSYGLAKSISETLVRHRTNSKFKMVCLRLGPVFGPGQSPENLIPYTVYSILRRATENLMASDVVWDPIYVSDAIEAICACIFQQKVWGEIINISGGIPYTPREIMRHIAQLMNVNNIKLERYKESNKNYPLPCIGEINQAKNLLGWQPRTTLLEGLRLTIDHICSDFCKL